MKKWKKKKQKQKQHKQPKRPAGFHEALEGPMYVLYFDGMCSPVNPQGICIGSFILYDTHGIQVGKGRELICRETNEATNNTGEWAALVLGLRFAKDLGVKRLEINGDSQIVLGSLTTFKRPAVHLQKWKDEAHSFLSEIEWTANHIPREDNAEADALGNELYEQIIVSEPFDESKLGDNHWYNKPPTDKQLAYLKRLGYDGEPPTTGKEASDLIGSLRSA